MYRKGMKSQAMIDGEERSRRVNQRPLRTVTGSQSGSLTNSFGLVSPGYFEVLDCGHTGAWVPRAAWITVGTKRRCLPCHHNRQPPPGSAAAHER